MIEFNHTLHIYVLLFYPVHHTLRFNLPKIELLSGVAVDGSQFKSESVHIVRVIPRELV